MGPRRGPLGRDFACPPFGGFALIRKSVRRSAAGLGRRPAPVENRMRVPAGPGGVNAAGRRVPAARPSAGAPFRCRYTSGMTILVCGSLAYDTIMVFPDQFKKHILPDQMHILNVSFMVPDMRREFGGCAGNIAYNLQPAGRRAAGSMAHRRPRLRALRAAAGRARLSRAARAPCATTSSPRRPSSPPTWTTTRSPPSIRARCRTRT